MKKRQRWASQPDGGKTHYRIPSSPHPCAAVTIARNANEEGDPELEPPSSERLSEVTCGLCLNWLRKNGGAWNAARAADHRAGTADAGRLA